MTGKYYTAENYESRSSIGYLLRHANKLLTTQVNELFTQQDLSFVQFIILISLRDGHAKTAAEINQYLYHDSGALTRVIDQLEERGFVKRERNNQDRRMMELILTMQGKSVADAASYSVFTHYNLLLANYAPEEVDMLIHLLTRLISNLQNVNSKEIEQPNYIST
jgi:DNA-binding MarR family transcriptional regulator